MRTLFIVTFLLVTLTVDPDYWNRIWIKAFHWIRIQTLIKSLSGPDPEHGLFRTKTEEKYSVKTKCFDKAENFLYNPSRGRSDSNRSLWPSKELLKCEISSFFSFLGLILFAWIRIHWLSLTGSILDPKEWIQIRKNLHWFGSLDPDPHLIHYTVQNTAKNGKVVLS